ncbi:hypothetical protein QZH41_008054 [Actinostola sp. cb2023]|nr:hypothetical protein QZH41_008054 [Actinostola sp. cb2023]
MENHDETNASGKRNGENYGIIEAKRRREEKEEEENMGEGSSGNLSVQGAASSSSGVSGAVGGGAQGTDEGSSVFATLDSRHTTGGGMVVDEGSSDETLDSSSSNTTGGGMVLDESKKKEDGDDTDEEGNQDVTTETLSLRAFKLEPRYVTFFVEALLFEGFGPSESWCLDEGLETPADVPDLDDYEGTFLEQFARAYAWLRACRLESSARSTPDPGLLSSAMIVEVNRLVTGHPKGKLSTSSRVTMFDGKIHEYPTRNLEFVLNRLVDRVNECVVNHRKLRRPLDYLVHLVARFVYGFLELHPFSDGNGRTVRLLYAYLMESGGVPFVPHITFQPTIIGRGSAIEFAPKGGKWRIRWGEDALQIADTSLQNWCRLLASVREHKDGWLRVVKELRKSLENQAERNSSTTIAIADVAADVDAASTLMAVGETVPMEEEEDNDEEEEEDDVDEDPDFEVPDFYVDRRDRWWHENGEPVLSETEWGWRQKSPIVQSNLTKEIKMAKRLDNFYLCHLVF